MTCIFPAPGEIFVEQATQKKFRVVGVTDWNSTDSDSRAKEKLLVMENITEPGPLLLFSGEDYDKLVAPPRWVRAGGTKHCPLPADGRRIIDPQRNIAYQVIGLGLEITPAYPAGEQYLILDDLSSPEHVLSKRVISYKNYKKMATSDPPELVVIQDLP